ncbi:hypothetical protein XENOCAPTIV_003807 [Xenoophorus captivus]|uniref:Uncharacterized protein n=1 Tax=Xenoophorus captivus TaxID=1517983 RepID=A0ABV0QM69_9TELE
MWGQPKVKLERLGLVKDFEKRPKPVVVLKKLSVDQIQRIIRHSKSGKNRFSGKSGKELLEEIESTMPMYERVKMNKRKRSTDTSALGDYDYNVCFESLQRQGSVTNGTKTEPGSLKKGNVGVPGITGKVGTEKVGEAQGAATVTPKKKSRLHLA